jgi:hypothetical protein
MSGKAIHADPHRPATNRQKLIAAAGAAGGAAAVLIPVLWIKYGGRAKNEIVRSILKTYKGIRNS